VKAFLLILRFPDLVEMSFYCGGRLVQVLFDKFNSQVQLGCKKPAFIASIHVEGTGLKEAFFK